MAGPDLDRAALHAETTLRLLPVGSNLSGIADAAHAHRGFILLQKNENQRAREYLAKALQFNAGNAPAHNAMGIVCTMDGKIREAVTHISPKSFVWIVVPPKPALTSHEPGRRWNKRHAERAAMSSIRLVAE